MYLEGHVNRGGPRRQLDEVSPGGENKYFILEQVDLQQLQEFLGGGLVILGNLHQFPQPADLAIHMGQFGLVRLLVAPVGRHPDLSRFIHLHGAQLHLNHLAPGTHHRCVQRLIAVHFRGSDKIIEAFLDWRI